MKKTVHTRDIKCPVRGRVAFGTSTCVLGCQSSSIYEKHQNVYTNCCVLLLGSWALGELFGGRLGRAGPHPSFDWVDADNSQYTAPPRAWVGRPETCERVAERDPAEEQWKRGHQYKFTFPRGINIHIGPLVLSRC